MKNLTDYRISELGTVITGKTPSSKNPEDWGDETPFVTPSDFDSYDKNIFSSVRYLSKVGREKLSKKLLPRNTVLVTCIGSQMGKVAINQVECITNQQINSIAPDLSLVNPHYLYYKLKGMRKDLQNLATGGSTMPIINKSDFESIILDLPDLPTQTAIAEILSSLDDKIELNNQINKHLEALAQAIFKRWFVDFEFPDENGQPYKSSGGEMVESELGLIPKGWKSTTLLEIADLISGGTPKTSRDDYWNGEIAWMSAKDVTANNRTFVLTTEKYITKAGLDQSSAKPLPRFSTVISARGTVGNYCLTSEEGTTISQSNYALKSKHAFDFYTYLLVGTLIAELKTKSYGTVFDTITTKTLAGINVLDIPHPTLQRFEDFIGSGFQLILNSRKENKSLTNLRDTLLSRLITGELQIKERANAMETT